MINFYVSWNLNKLIININKRLIIALWTIFLSFNSQGQSMQPLATVGGVLNGLISIDVLKKQDSLIINSKDILTIKSFNFRYFIGHTPIDIFNCGNKFSNEIRIAFEELVIGGALTFGRKVFIEKIIAIDESGNLIQLPIIQLLVINPQTYRYSSNCRASINGISEGKINKNILLFGKFTAECNNEKLEITEFTVHCYYCNGYKETYRVEGNKLSKEVRHVIQIMRKGQRIYFENIIAKRINAPNSILINLPTIGITLE